MKTHHTPKTSPMLTPVLVAGLVLALPLAATSPAAVMLSGLPGLPGVPSRATAVAGVTGVGGSQERAEYLVRCVSEAARQFCAAHVAAMFCETGLALDAADEIGLVVPAVITAPRQYLTHQLLIDLPPPDVTN